MNDVYQQARAVKENVIDGAKDLVEDGKELVQDAAALHKNDTRQQRGSANRPTGGGDTGEEDEIAEDENEEGPQSHLLGNQILAATCLMIFCCEHVIRSLFPV